MKNLLNLMIVIGVSTLSACGFLDNIMPQKTESADPVLLTSQLSQEKKVPKEYSAIVEKKTYPEVRTTKGANQLDLETPLRCFVNWDTQQMISTIPYNVKAFSLSRNGKNDILPRFEVNGFSFDTMSAEKALLKLTKEAGLKLVAKDAPYASILGENLHGDFTDVINMIAEAGEVYYTYNATNKTLRLSRKANFSLEVPKSRTIMMAVLDVLRGSGITDFVADFDDYTVTFDADFDLRNKIVNLINYFEENPVLLAYDIKVFNLYPYEKESVDWQKIIQTFEFGTIKSTKSGVIGRVLTTSNEINIASLTSFLSRQARVETVSEGKFVVPNMWFSRFDIGKCAARNSMLADLSILAKASFEQNDKIFSSITLEGRDGEISQFSVRSKLGENFLIIGLPNSVFGKKTPTSETIMMVVPRVIKKMKTTKALENNL